ncbi:MAG: BlaI/MecI/CopY family transcriptional regulator [Candidatus Vecturithrix sp.]|jgi:predicted transcriptional regulator|nr:BlaI/MecI/CopY family transcriptional regulator [Candidatus Vecturithrix sp.]
MSQRELPDLSKAEYDILRILWKKKEKQTVREVHDELYPTYHWAYTTTKTMMDRMITKGLLRRDSFHGVYVYTPLISRPAGLARIVQFFADRVLETDTSAVVAMFAKSRVITVEEIQELEQLLQEEHTEEE